MRPILNSLSDPILHFMLVALILVFLAFGRGPSKPDEAESPLSYCRKCHVHFLPERTCDCHLIDRIANARP